MNVQLTLRTEGDFCHQRRDTEINTEKPIDMTIHWKALKEHVLIIHVPHDWNIFWWQYGFSEIFPKFPRSFKELMLKNKKSGQVTFILK
jgi:hypothetical protein